MIIFTENYDDSVLVGLGLVVEDLIILQGLLTDKEFKKVDGIKDDAERVNKIVNMLNNRRALPEEYKGLTATWKGFEGVENPEKEMCY